MLKRKKNRIMLVSMVLVLVTVVGLIVTPTLTAKAETYDEKNPEFKEARINSDAELNYGVKSAYEQDTVFTQSTESGKYEIDTNAYVVWTMEDDVAFLYRQYNIGNTRDDRLVVEVTVDSQEATKGTGLFSTASSGLMIRDSVTNAGSAHIYLHTRSTGVDVVYRPQEGGSMGHVASRIIPVYPVTLRIEKTGQKYVCSFKNGDSDIFVNLASVGCVTEGEIYAGVASHSTDQNRPIHSVYSNYSAVGSGTIVAGEPGEDVNVNKEPEKLEYEDAPYDTENTLLYETFSDGSMVAGKEQVNNPVWSDEWGEILINEDKTDRDLYIAFEEGSAFAGDEKWTDYSVSMDYELAEGVSTAGEENLILWVRHKAIEPYGYYGVGVAIRTETVKQDGQDVTIPYLTVYHRQRSSVSSLGKVKVSERIDEMIGSGVHTLRVDCMDNTFTFYIDGKKIADYTDDSTSPNLRGCIGIQGTEIEAYIDNIVVTKLEDIHGGDYDNYIGANYNDDVPEYIKEFEKMNN